MNQQHKVVIKQLMPELLNDDMLDRADWSSEQGSDVSDFKAFWRTSPYHITEVKGVLFSCGRRVNSSSFRSIFLRVTFPSTLLLPRNKDQLRRLLPEPAYGWYEATSDERGRVWVCDRYGKYVAVVHPDEQEGHGFVLPGYYPYGVQAIAAYDNTVAMASDKELFIYYYNEAAVSLKEMFHWKDKDRIIRIKPDVEERGLWVLIYPSSSSRYVLKYLPLNGKVSAPREVEQTSDSFEVRTLGDWPEKVYFAYIDDNERVLRYTLNPKKGWHRVSLQNVVRGGAELSLFPCPAMAMQYLFWFMMMMMPTSSYACKRITPS